ncbi:multidrug efflux SMR transporter [Sporomusa sp. KB1]|jgi:small multidrug resistance pump|uniref:DMT family transporter n=1 Tax=Sporomusa sp. KB1 TaxID=943346 RepID=UPI00119D7049|nr:multidrug efflux SMR transporter [Sporomusa sp. KB1]TWH52127.1 small multidrug resistance pump [Sporomusa sp. KB1]
MNAYVLLAIAIVCEIFATSMLKASVGFTKLAPSLAFIIVMSASFYAVSQALNQIPLGIAYAIWSGLGTALTALIAVFIWKETMNAYTVTGIILVIIGVVLLNLKGAGH